MKQDQKPSTPPALNKVTQLITKSPTSRLLAGLGTGWLTGFLTVRGGRVPVAVLGTGIILLQVAQTQGIVKQSWKDVQTKANELKEGQRPMLDNAKNFARDNPEFAAGFSGGFLIGLAC